MTEIQLVNRAEEVVGETIDTAVGGFAAAVDAVRRPRRAATRARRRGEPLVDAAEARAARAADRAIALPERVLVASLRQIRSQAHRGDVIGVAARTLLEVVRTPSTHASDFFGRVVHETELPRHAPRDTAGTHARNAARRATRRVASATSEVQRPRRGRPAGTRGGATRGRAAGAARTSASAGAKRATGARGAGRTAARATGTRARRSA